MGDNPESVRDTLHALYLRAQTDPKARANAQAALAAELDRLVYKVRNGEPDEGARAFLVDILFATAKNSEARAAEIDATAFGDAHPENRRAAGIVHVTRSSQAKAGAERKKALKEDAKNGRLDPYARNLAGLLLVKEWREEIRQNADSDFYREAKEFMNNEEDYLKATRVEVAKFLLDFCVNKGKAFPVVAEIVTSGKWPELAEEAGVWLVDHYIRAGNPMMANRIAEFPETPEKVKEYAAKRFGEIGFRPLAESGRATISGMPAWKPNGAKEKPAEARGVPPSPDSMQRRVTLRGPPK